MIPININIVVEDRLSEAVVKAVLSQSEKKFNVVKRFPDLKRIHSSSGFGYIKIKISGFNKAARGIPFLVLTDLDDYECPPGTYQRMVKRTETSKPDISSCQKRGRIMGSGRPYFIGLLFRNTRGKNPF
jgi:hypothetical protein